MQQAEVFPITIDEYLQGELGSDIRHAFYDGKIVAIAGEGEKHNIITGNFAVALRQRARGSGSRVFMIDMKVHIPELNRFYYPDVLLVCDSEDDHEYYKENPCLIIEVLSPSTESIDRREKLHTYQSIRSLKEYILVSQEKMQIELYRRDKGHWQYYLLDDEKDVLHLECIDMDIDMPTAYEDIVF